tara:strand:+ start:39 stop:1202 length:1164 start_codon:yes stop_codon:yes gene_type:complete
MDKVCILGTGKQGTAAAYDLLLYAKPKKMILLDSIEISLKSCLSKIESVKSTKTEIVLQKIDLNNKNELISILKDYDIMLSAVPYPFNPMLTEVAIESNISMVDLGGHTQNVIKQLSYHNVAKEKNISIVPDCGMGPGMNITMALLAMEQFDKPEEILIWDGGLPQNPKPPWNYSLFFNIQGLTNEYDGNASFIRDGKIEEVKCFEDIEELEFDDIGVLEAAVTSGGLSTMPWTFEGTLKRLENKTLRYKGHWEQMKSFRELGLFSEEKINFKNSNFSPREFYHSLLEPKLGYNDRLDICLMRVDGYGLKNNKKETIRYEVIEKYDDKTKFMAMEKWTGWHASIVMQKIMDGTIRPGAYAIEKALSGHDFYNEIIKRNYNIKLSKIN